MIQFYLTQGSKISDWNAWYLNDGDNGTFRMKRDNRSLFLQVKDGKCVKRITTEKHGKSEPEKVVEVYGKSIKYYVGKRLIKEERFEDNRRRLRNGLYYQSNDYKKGYSIKRYTKNGKIVRETMQWIKDNGKRSVCYVLNEGDKKVNVYNKDGSLLAKLFCYGKLKRFNSNEIDEKKGFHLTDITMQIDKLKDLTFFVTGHSWMYEVYNKDRLTNSRSGVGRMFTNGTDGIVPIRFIKGIQVSENIWSGNYTASDILEIENVTLKSELIERYGLQKMIKELEARTIDSKDGYTLVEIDNPKGLGENSVIRALQMRCPSTGILYMLRVPPNMSDCEIALQWAYGVNIRLDGKDKEKFYNIIKAS